MPKKSNKKSLASELLDKRPALRDEMEKGLYELLQPGARGGIVFDDQHAFLYDPRRVFAGPGPLAGGA